MRDPIGYSNGHRITRHRRPSRAPSGMIASWQDTRRRLSDVSDTVLSLSPSSGNRTSASSASRNKTPNTKHMTETERNTFINTGSLPRPGSGTTPQSRQTGNNLSPTESAASRIGERLASFGRMGRASIITALQRASGLDNPLEPGISSVSSAPAIPSGRITFAEPASTALRAISAPLMIEPTSIGSLDRETFYAPGEQPDAAQPQYITAVHWTGDEKICFHDPFPERRDGSSRGAVLDRPTTTKPVTSGTSLHLPTAVPPAADENTNPQVQSTDDRTRQDTLAGSMSANTAAKQKDVQPITREEPDELYDLSDDEADAVSKAEGHAARTEIDSDAITEAEQSSFQHEQSTLESDFTRPNHLPPAPLAGRLDYTNDVMDNREPIILLEDDPTVSRRDFARFHRLPLVNAQIDGANDDQISPKSHTPFDRVAIRPRFQSGGYRNASGLEMIPVLQRLHQLDCVTDHHTRGFIMNGRIESEEKIMVVRWL